MKIDNIFLFIQSSLDSNNRNVRVFQILPKFGEYVCGAWQLCGNEGRTFENRCIVHTSRQSFTILNCVVVNEACLQSVVHTSLNKYVH